MAGNEQKRKISDEFEARLESVSPDAKLSAVVMLELPRAGSGRTRRVSREERRQRVQGTSDAAGPALAEIDGILKRHAGRRLSAKVNALGSLSVETTPAGIRELAASDKVRAVIEDQKISLLSSPKQKS